MRRMCTEQTSTRPHKKFGMNVVFLNFADDHATQAAVAAAEGGTTISRTLCDFPARA